MKDVEANIEEKLIDLASQYVPDMRLLKNVRNEFIVFRDRIFSGDGEQLTLNETELFAMMLYKSTHLADFEAIRIGRSRLDQLYGLFRELVLTNIKRIESETRTFHKRLSRLDNITEHSTRLGDHLIAHVERTVRAVGYQQRNASYTLNGKAKTEADLRSTSFWTEFVNASSDSKLVWSVVNYPQRKLSFSRTDLADALHSPLEPDHWNDAERKGWQEAIEKNNEDLKFLRGADIGDLIERSEFLIEHEDFELSLDAHTRRFLKKGLAYQLLRAGYINRNFTLYTSTFHGNRVSSAATNFIIHHIERDLMDEYFELSDDDVDAVIRECGKKALREPALYNIAILDQVLRAESEATDIMVNSLKRLGDDQKRFLQAYLNSGREAARFVARFAATSSEALVYLVSQVELDEPARIRLISTALKYLAEGVEYTTDANVTAYLASHYAELPILTSKAIEASAAKRVAKVFLEAGIRVPVLEPLSKNARRAFVTQNLYVINKENLGIALGSNASLALDKAREANTAVYKYLTENLSAYLSAINGVSVTIDSELNFTVVIEDVLAKAPDQLNEVIAHASTNCIVTDLENVSEEAWEHLAQYGRFPATYNNIDHYISSAGTLDAHLARILASDRKISAHKTYEETCKERLAKMIFAAQEYLPSASLRTGLVSSLQLENYLNVDQLPAESGELFSLLLKEEIISDDANTYAHLSETDWPTRELVINISTRFKDYMTPDLVKGDLAALLLSDKVAPDVKLEVINNADDYLEGSSKRDLAQLARFAIQQKRQVTLSVIERLASSGVPAQSVVILLEQHLPTLSSEQLFPILQSLGEPYSQLTFVGRDRPKIPSTSEGRALLHTLKEQGIVTTYKTNAGVIRINKKYK